jgi:hypothetical protein
MTAEDGKPPIRLPHSMPHGSKPPSEASGRQRPPSERSGTLHLSPTELADLLEGAVGRACEAMRSQWRDEQNARVITQGLQAELTTSRSKLGSVVASRRKMFYALVTAAAIVAGGVVERFLGRPAEVARETASQVVDEREAERLERIDSMIRALEAERDSTAP